MSEPVRIYLSGDYSRQKAVHAITRAKPGQVMELRDPTRTDDQNRILHAIIDEVREQHPDGPTYSKEDWKLRFLQGLRNETKFLPELDGGGMFPVGQRTSTLSRAQFSALLEIVFAWCAREGVELSDETRRLAA